MKKANLLYFSLILLISSCTQTTNSTVINKKYFPVNYAEEKEYFTAAPRKNRYSPAIWYYRGSPFTGIFYENYNNGKLKLRFMFIDGKQQCEAIQYIEDSLFEGGGELRIYNTKDGLNHGLFDWYDSNGLWKEDDRKRDLGARQIYVNGRIVKEGYGENANFPVDGLLPEN